MNTQTEIIETFYFIASIIGLCAGSMSLGFGLGYLFSMMSEDTYLPLIGSLDCRVA